jgi:hypothetical protein
MDASERLCAAMTPTDPAARRSHEHTSFQTTQLYVRKAEAIRDGFGIVFPPLPPSVAGTIDRAQSSRESSQAAQLRGTFVRREGLELPAARWRNV